MRARGSWGRQQVKVVGVARAEHPDPEGSRRRRRTQLQVYSGKENPKKTGDCSKRSVRERIGRDDKPQNEIRTGATENPKSIGETGDGESPKTKAKGGTRRQGESERVSSTPKGGDGVAGVVQWW